MALVKFKNGFNGTYEIGGQVLQINENGIHPYDMTFGAVASCLYSTLLDVCEHRKIELKSSEVTVDGVKRTSVPATLEHVTIRIVTDTDTDIEDLKKAMNRAVECCSMVQTVAEVAEIEYSIEKK
ncbi:MAG: hypothetical protein EOM64_06605 [Erysipelotrichia bacterium]|nr:hypothetical protein [Erysipelotrichia bacterium]